MWGGREGGRLKRRRLRWIEFLRGKKVWGKKSGKRKRESAGGSPERKWWRRRRRLFSTCDGGKFKGGLGKDEE